MGKLTKQLDLEGMTKVLAANCALKSFTDTIIHLEIDPKHASLANEKQQQQLQHALQKKFSESLKLKIDTVITAGITPAQQTETKLSQDLENAKNDLIEDPHVQSILQDFGGSLDEKSIKLVKP